jgi:hypothetical protein
VGEVLFKADRSGGSNHVGCIDRDWRAILLPTI